LLHNLDGTVRGKEGVQEISAQNFRLFASVCLNDLSASMRDWADEIHHQHRGARRSAGMNRPP